MRTLAAKLRQRAATAITFVPGCARALRRARARLLAIPMYHGVVAEPQPVFNWCQLELARFEQEINFLTTEYRVLPLGEMVSRLRKGLPLPDRAAAVTFDDGYRSVYKNAFMILQRYQAPFTVFLITGLVDSGQLVWTDRLFVALEAANAQVLSLGGESWPIQNRVQRALAYRAVCARLKKMPVERKDAAMENLLLQLAPAAAADSAFALMSWEEIELLAKSPLAQFGSHTHTHPILARCSPDRQKSELRQSRDVLQEHLGTAELFAYPNGTAADFDVVTRTLVQDLGYLGAVTTIAGLNSAGDDPYQLRRVNVGADDTLAQFESMMLGF